MSQAAAWPRSLAYCLSCQPCDCYVGLSKTIEQRWKSHISQLKKGRHPVEKMQALADEHGVDSFSFEVLEVCEPQSGKHLESVLKAAERKWMDELGPELTLRGTEREAELYRRSWTPERKREHGEKIRAMWKDRGKF